MRDWSARQQQTPPVKWVRLGSMTARTAFGAKHRGCATPRSLGAALPVPLLSPSLPLSSLSLPPSLSPLSPRLSPSPSLPLPLFVRLSLPVSRAVRLDVLLIAHRVEVHDEALPRRRQEVAESAKGRRATASSGGDSGEALMAKQLPSSCGTVRRGDAPRPELQVKSLAAHVDEVAGGTSAGAKPLCEHERLVEVQKQVQFAPAELILSVGALQQRDVLLHLLLGALRAVVAERTREQLPQVAPRRARQPVLLSEARVRHTHTQRAPECGRKPPGPHLLVPDRPSKILFVQVGTLSSSHPSFGPLFAFLLSPALAFVKSCKGGDVSVTVLDPALAWHDLSFFLYLLLRTAERHR